MSAANVTPRDVAAPVPTPYGEIYDRGYRHYDGPRLGRRHAIWALILYSVKRAMGIKKSWTAKVIPILLYVAVALPVVVSIGIRAFLPNSRVLEYQGFFNLTFLIEGIFVATIAPEMLCGDRRENVLPLYFSRAITRADYVLAKLAATALLTLTISFVPSFVMWLGFQLLDTHPLSAMAHHVDDLGRIAVAGVAIAFYLGAGGLMISSFTGRKSVAVAVIIIGFLVSTSLAYALQNAVDPEAQIRRYMIFLSPSDTEIGLVSGLFHTLPNQFGRIADFPVWAYLVEMAGIVVVACGVMYWRYVPNE